VKDLTAGKGYRLTASQVQDALRETLRARASAFAVRDGVADFHFGTLEDANEAIDLLRREHCPIESLAQTSSTLEEVFVKTIGNGGASAGGAIATSEEAIR
jgi:hypothetical protein